MAGTATGETAPIEPLKGQALPCPALTATRPKREAVRDRLLYLLLISAAIASWPISDGAEEITPAELAILVGAFVAVLAVQATSLWIANRWTSDGAERATVALLVAANAYHFAFLTLEARTVVRVLLAAAVGAGVWWLLRARWPSAPVHIFAVAFTALSLANYGSGRVGLAEGSAKQSVSAHAIPVQSDRNVYLISVESLPSPHALRRLFGIDDPPHLAYLAAEGFRVLDRSYSVDTSTRVTYQRLMEFSRPLETSRDLKRVFKSGNSAFSSFQAGGYAIQFIYISNYMNLNHALVNHAFPKVGFYICDNLEPAFFYFICRDGPRSIVNAWLFGVRGQVTVGEEIAHLRERIAVAAADARPWLTISHIAYPGHTPKTHRYDDRAALARFRDTARGYMPRIAAHYRDIVSSIRHVDPHAVVVTFGDHGMWLTRGMEDARSNAVFSAEDYAEDRYGAFVAVYPAGFCRNRIGEGASTRLLVKSIILCLNGDDAPGEEDRRHSKSVVYRNELVGLDTFGIRP
jgi:hypothetical protein